MINHLTPSSLFHAHRSGNRAGTSLPEVMVALVIAAMVLVAVLGVFNHVQRSSSAIIKEVESSHLPSEVLQLIAEDIDRLVDSSKNVQLTVENKSDNGYPIARLVLTKTYTDMEAVDQVLEKITWQAAVDLEVGRVVLYRCHEGLLSEDTLHDQKRTDVEKLFPFIPVCGGLTAFSIRVPQGVNWLDRWQNPKLPTGIEVMLSLGDPVDTPSGQYEILAQDQILRTIAIDRTRTIPFAIEPTSE
jgi:hypothetical protein